MMEYVISPGLTGAGFNYTVDMHGLVARGLVGGSYMFSSYGVRTSIGAESEVAVWPNGAFLLPASTGVQMSVVSTSADDDAAGTGVRTVEIHYLDATLEPQKEVVSLDGLTPVLTTATDIRFIQCMHISSVGTSTSAVGTITATNGGTTYSEIYAGYTRCSSSFRMVPADKQLYINAAVGSSISGTAAARTQLSLVSNYFDGHLYAAPLILIPFASIGVQDNNIGMPFYDFGPFPAGAVVGAVHTSDKACTVSATWFGRIEEV